LHGFGPKEITHDMDKIASISEQLLQFSPDALIVVDLQGVILFANATSRALFRIFPRAVAGTVH
jgi:PAS domain-containing protein